MPAPTERRGQAHLVLPEAEAPLQAQPEPRVPSQERLEPPAGDSNLRERPGQAAVEVELRVPQEPEGVPFLELRAPGRWGRPEPNRQAGYPTLWSLPLGHRREPKVRVPGQPVPQERRRKEELPVRAPHWE